MELKISVPEGVTVAMDGHTVKVKGPKGELSRKFEHPLVKMAFASNEFTVTSADDRRATRALAGTWGAHMRNMFRGVTEGYEKKMKIVHVHFPMSVKVEKDRVSVVNLLGQKNAKYAKIEHGVGVKIEGDEILLEGIDKEKVGQTVGNIETATKLSNRRDRRRFYDGIYLVGQK